MYLLYIFNITTTPLLSIFARVDSSSLADSIYTQVIMKLIRKITLLQIITYTHPPFCSMIRCLTLLVIRYGNA